MKDSQLQFVAEVHGGVFLESTDPSEVIEAGRPPYNFVSPLDKRAGENAATMESHIISVDRQRFADCD